jgi:hypothetical protein
MRPVILPPVSIGKEYFFLLNSIYTIYASRRTYLAAAQKYECLNWFQIRPAWPPINRIFYYFISFCYYLALQKDIELVEIEDGLKIQSPERRDLYKRENDA